MNGQCVRVEVSVREGKRAVHTGTVPLETSPDRQLFVQTAARSLPYSRSEFPSTSTYSKLGPSAL
jgi:hypothetical protein